MAVRIFGVRLGRPTQETPTARAGTMWSLPGGFGIGYPMGGASEGLEQALLNSASYACIDVLVDHISAAPLDAVRYFKNGRARQPVSPVPALLRNPSGVVSLGVWKTQLAFALVTDGNAFGRIVQWSGARPLQVEWLDPSTVTKRRIVGGYPTVEIDRQDHRLYPNGDILHIPGRMISPGSPFALSPIEYANATIGTSLSAQRYTSQWFDGGGHPSVEVVVDGELTMEQAAQTKSNVLTSRRTGEPWVHSNMLETKPTQEKPDTTALEVVHQAAIMACQIWHVPPAWIYMATDGQSSITYANLTQADISGLKDSVDVYFRREEDVLSLCLPDPQVVRVNRDAVLKMDAPTRVDVQLKRLQAKLMSVNEGREQEDLEPWSDPIYDKPGLPAVAGEAPVPPPTIPPTTPNAPH